jgi:hypothetical protein
MVLAQRLSRQTLLNGGGRLAPPSRGPQGVAAADCAAGLTRSPSFARCNSSRPFQPDPRRPSCLYREARNRLRETHTAAG